MYKTGLNEILLQTQFILLKGNNFKVKSGQLVNHNDVRKMISDDQIFSSLKNIRGTPQYFPSMLLDVLVNIRHFEIYTFFLT